MHTGFETSKEALDFIFAGKSKVTMTSKTTGKHFTFKVDEGKDGDIFFVKVLNGPNNAWNGDWLFLGFIKADGEGNRTTGFIGGRKGHPEAPSFKAFQWAVSHLDAGTLPEALTIQHQGSWGACGRELTDPISLATGLGPICAGR